LTYSGSTGIMTHQNMKFDKAICLMALLFGLATAASAQTSAADGGSLTGPISGYMEFHLNNPEARDATLDFHRFVLILNHSFSPRIRFVGELELEHAFVAGLEESGEVELEQAYVDFLLTRAFNIRAGMLLVPSTNGTNRRCSRGLNGRSSIR
jgi:hypothetical protein